MTSMLHPQGVVSIPVDRRKTEVKVELVETSSGSRNQLVNPERVTKCSDPTDLVELARQVQKGEEFVRARAVGRLEIIAEQIRHLQEQAKRVLQEAHRDDILHHVACNFKKIPGNVYHLYQRPSGQKYFSMVSPEEWGPTCPNHYLGSYKLEADQSWTPAAHIATRKQEIDLLDNILNAKKSICGSEPLIDTGGPVPPQGVSPPGGINETEDFLMEEPPDG